MAPQQTIRPSRKLIVYQIAKWTWLITAWIWTSIIIAFLVQFVPNLLTTQNPATTLQNSWTTLTLNWLRTPNTTNYLEILRVSALGVALLLVILPLVAFIVKQMLQNVQREGLDKLFDILQQDNISPKLEDLQHQIQLHLNKQDMLVNGLSHMLQRIPATNQAGSLYMLLQKQLQTQGQIAHILQNIPDSLRQTTTAMLQKLDDLHVQEQKEQIEVMQIVQSISSDFKLVLTQLNTISLLSERDNGTESSQFTTSARLPAIFPPSETDQFTQADANLTIDDDPSVAG